MRTSADLLHHCARRAGEGWRDDDREKKEVPRESGMVFERGSIKNAGGLLQYSNVAVVSSVYPVLR